MLTVITTGDSRESLERLARELVERRLAACCQLEGPVTSIYRWQGSVETGEEYRCFIKTTEHRYAEVERFLLEHHPYDQPQIVALLSERVERGYEHWVRESVEDR